MTLKSQIESLLFVALKPLGVKELAAFIKASEADLEQALEGLAADYISQDSGLALVKNAGRYQLTTASGSAEAVKTFLQDETSGELSQPSLETLTIIAYRGPIAKLELERIRGVNCSLILRNLLLRGLIEEKLDRASDSPVYTVTHDFVRWLGLTALDNLPEYGKLHDLSLEGEAVKEV